MTKQRLEDLAMFGGEAAFAEPLHVGRPTIGDRDRLMQRFTDLLDRRWFTNNGPLVQEFERRLQDYLGVPHVIATCNATIALQMAIRALGLKGEVIAPAFTFVATVHALSWQEVTPVFCDVDPATHNLAPTEIEALVSPRTTGIIPVHVWGRACDVEAIDRIAQKHSLKVIYDAAHALGSTSGRRKLGGFGNAEVFSFHATKFCNSFEGGAVATRDPELAQKLKLMRNFGFAGYDQVIHLGINGKMTEVCAAMGITSLESVDDFIETNRRNHRAYARALANVPGISIVPYRDDEEHNFQYVVLEVDAPVFGLSRDELVALLHSENILARRYFYPACHRMEPYASTFPPPRRPLTVTERLVERLLSVPTGTAVSVEQVQTVCELISFVGAHSAAVSKARKEIR